MPGDVSELMHSILGLEYLDVDQLLILRGVRTGQLIYSPALTLYFNACLLGCQSPIVIVRLYSYSLLKGAPMTMDIGDLMGVLTHAISIWEKGPVSFEFSASLYILLRRFSEQRATAKDEAEHGRMVQKVARLHDSDNFETLMCFDTTLQWLFASLSPAAIVSVAEFALRSLENNRSGDFYIICRSIEMGLTKTGDFGGAVKMALETVAGWAHPVQKRARAALATLPFSVPGCTSTEIVDIIAEGLMRPQETAEPCLYIFAQFLVGLYLGTSAPLHLRLLEALLNMVSQSEGKRNMPRDIQNITVAVCSNPVRFLEVLKVMSEKRQMLMPFVKQNEVWYNSLVLAVVAPSSSVLASDSHVKGTVKAVIGVVKEITGTACEDDVHRFEIGLPLLIALYPNCLRKLVEYVGTGFDEDMCYHVIEMLYVVVLQGRIPGECKELREILLSPKYKCEYSDLLELVDAALETCGTNLERLTASIDASLSQFLVIGSASNTAAALLFEHIVWSEGGPILVMFKRLRVKPAQWFAGALASMFTSLVDNPTGPFLDFVERTAKDSAQRLVWIGFLLFRKMVPKLESCFISEKFDMIPQTLLYPRAPWELTSEDGLTMEHLDQKYLDVLRDLFCVMVPAKTPK